MTEAFFKTILKAKKSIDSSYRKTLTDRSYAESGFIWIYDNYHILSESYNNFRFSPLGKAKETPLLFGYTYNFLSENNFETTEEEFTGFLLNYGESRYLTYDELFALSALLCGVCIYETGRICRLAEKDSDYSSEIHKIESAISLLREKETWDFEKIFSKVSKTDKILSKFERTFPIMDSNTKNKYRETLSSFCKSQKIGEMEGAELLKTYCLENDLSASEILMKEDRKSATLFTAISSLFTVTLTAIAVYFIGTIGALLCIPSLITTAFALSDLLMSSSEKQTPCPALKLKTIPKEGKTAVVISTILIDKRENEKIARNLERYYLLNRDENIFFTVLADFPTSQGTTPTDSETETMEDLFSHIERLNGKYQNRFSAMARNRKYYEEEHLCFGEERKRGAITSLVYLITEKDKSYFDYYEGNTDNLYETKFLFLLDSDTGIGFSAVKTAVSCALHPVNIPVIENGRVIKGYGVFQPSVKFELIHEKKTDFESFISGAGGIDNYESASYERFQSVFGSGIFCGKGLVNVELYKETVAPTMPKGKILSHDMPEGNLLRCRLVSELTTTDNAPTNAISYFSRQHRWIRGDVQNLIFATQKQLRKKMSPFSVFKILNNILRHITPIASFILLTLSALGIIGNFSKSALFSTLYLTLPFVSVIVFAPFRAYNKTVVLGRRFYSEVTGVYFSNLLRFIYEIATLPYNAYVSLNAFAKSTWRMVFSKKKLLEWKTFELSEKTTSKGVIGYFSAFWINILFGAVFIFANSLTSNLATKLLLSAFGLIWLLTPFVLYLLSKPKEEKERISPKEKEALFYYSEKIWKFFSDFVDARTNYLPPDNVQLAPTDAVAMRTSPTNIGLYLLSCLSASDFGFISNEELSNRIDKTLSSVEKLEKWNGHLFNWYELKHLNTLGERFVSTVDSGNFITSLVALREGLEEKGIWVFTRRINNIIDSTDFSALYNQKKKLFSIGMHTDENRPEKNCYDLFMSEARTTSYFAVAKGEVPYSHWKSLGRTIISNKRFMGLASWSGTMFEYFMPALLLPIYKNSFSYEALSFAFHEQKKLSAMGIWGISESGFYAFDSSLNYQYKAHGIPSLSLKRYARDELVFSPYSAFLTLCINRKNSISNLERFKEIGAWGNYGFYEAVDLTAEKAIVKSYMAHHMGMSIVACANACFGNIFVKRFMSDKEMSSANGLLKEKIPTNAPVFENPSSKMTLTKAKLFCGVTSMPSLSSPETAVISSGNLNMIIADFGTVQLLYRGIPINEAYFELGKINHSLSVGFIDGNGKTKYIAPLLSQCFDKCTFEFGMDYSSHIISEKDFASSVNYYLSQTNDCFIIETKGNIKRKLSPFLVFEPQMAKNSYYYSAKSFSCMKTKVEFEENCLFVTSENVPFTVCVSCNGKIAKYLTSRDSLEVNELFHNLEKGENIPSVYPLCYLRASHTSGGCCKFYIGVGKTKEQSRKAVLKEMQRNTAKNKNSSTVNPALLGKIASRIIFNKPKYTSNGFVFAREELWKKGVSGDFPIYALYVKDFHTGEIEEHLKVYNALYRGYIKYDLFLFYDEEDLYFGKTRQKLNEIISKCKCDSLKDKSPGIHLLQAKELFTVKDCFCAFETISNRFHTDEKTDTLLPLLPERKKEPLCVCDGKQGEVPFTGCKGKTATKQEAPLACDDKSFIEIKENGFVFRKDRIKKRKPYSYVLSGRNFGSVVTDSSLGFTFSDNSRLCKITLYDESPNALSGEKLLAYYENKLYDLCYESVIFSCKSGVANYRGSFSDVEFSITVFVSPNEKRKYISVIFSKENIACCYSFTPFLGETLGEGCKIQWRKTSEKRESVALFYNMLSVNLKNTLGYCASKGNGETKELPTTFGNEITLSSCGSECIFVLGEINQNRYDETNRIAFSEDYISDLSQRILKEITFESAEKQREEQEIFSASFIPKLSFKTDFDDLEKIFPFLFYQTAASRFFARTGFYQNGGAFGFRDQLQDCLSLVYSRKTDVRNHILNCASHQYKDGSVMHWWHEIKGEHFGIKTTCSDDYLYLPLVCAKYIRVTGDGAILWEEAPFVESPPLGELNERYEKGVFSKDTATLYHHCILSLKRGFENCKNGIPLMGCCDWNDGFSQKGIKGEGISIFTAWLLIMATEAFAPYMESKPFLFDNTDCGKGEAPLSHSESTPFSNNSTDKAPLYRNESTPFSNNSTDEAPLYRNESTPFSNNSTDKAPISHSESTPFSNNSTDEAPLSHNESREKYSKEWFLENASRMGELIESKYFINGQYVRCVSDDGTYFGIGETKACATDILCQAFAVFAGKNKKRAKEALLFAFEKLYDKKTETLKLFYPPFGKDTENGGYINLYPHSVRENGGQYTHAAVWTAIALIQCGEGELGLKLLSKINPISRCKTVEKAEIYKNEPYVLSADIYSDEFGGRGGWSWYTGAASWYSVAIIEYVLGLKFRGSTVSNGKEVYLGDFKSVEIKPLIPYTAKLQLGDYSLTVIAKKGIPSVKADGAEAAFPYIIPPRDSVIEVFFE